MSFRGLNALRALADPLRMDTVALWVSSDDLCSRRAAFATTPPRTKLKHPKADDIAIRAGVLEWAAGLTTASEWFIQKAFARWLRDLSRHSPKVVSVFMRSHGINLQFLRRKSLKIGSRRTILPLSKLSADC